MAADNSLLPPEVFLDTSFIASLTVRDDANHAAALRIQVSKNGVKPPQ